MIREAIANYINARANYIKSKAEDEKPCSHKWKLLDESSWNDRLNTGFKWKEYTYFCDKCGESKKFSTKQ